jgi:hypothetical protein
MSLIALVSAGSVAIALFAAVAPAWRSGRPILAPALRRDQ